MKRIFALLLAVIMVLCLCACGGDTEEGGKESGGSGVLEVGVSRQSIMPTSPIGLHISGGGDPNRISTGYLDELTITCIAITDANGETVLIYSQDLHGAHALVCNSCKIQIKGATGIPEDHIYMSATHTHSGLMPDDQYGSTEFSTLYYDAVLKAAEEALADRAPAVMHGGNLDINEVSDQDMAFVRHYSISDGSVDGSNFGKYNNGKIVGHPYEADQVAQLIRFVREGKDKDVLMMNWPAHSTFNGTTTLLNVSADYPSPLRGYIEENTNCVVGVFLAGAGDQVPNSLWTEDNHGLDYQAYGKALGKLVVDNMDSVLKPIADGGIKQSAQTYTAKSNPSDAETLSLANDVYKYFLHNGQTAGNAYATQNGFYSVYEARAIVSRSGLPETDDIPMEAMSLGNMSFVFAPYEMSGPNARFIRENTPFDMTFVIAYCNDAYGYIPVPENFEYNGGRGSYEAYASNFIKGTAEILADNYISMLGDLKNG